MSLAATLEEIPEWLLWSDAVQLLASSREIHETPQLQAKGTKKEKDFEIVFSWKLYTEKLDALLQLTGADTLAGADTTAKRLWCHYNHAWCPHIGWMSLIRMKGTKKRNRYACARCIEWLQMNRVQFQFTPCAEEANQIY